MTLPAGLLPNDCNIELFANPDQFGKCLFIQNGQTRPFHELPMPIITNLMHECFADKKAAKGLNLMGIDMELQTEQYNYCNRGRLDGVPDISASGKFTKEFVNCGRHGKCVGEGLVCKLEFDGVKITHRELQCLKSNGEGKDYQQIKSDMGDAKTMLEGLRELSEQPLKLCFNPETYSFEIYHEYGRFKIHASEANFPTVKINSTDAKSFSIDASNFVFGLSSVVKFAGNDELRPMTNAVYVGLDQNTITFCASDTHVLSEVKIKSEASLEKSELTLPQKLTKLLIDLVESDDITVEFNQQHICISSGFYTVVYRQIEGKYFNYKSIIPQNNHNILTVDTRLIKSSISRVSVFSNKASYLISLFIKDNKLKISGRDVDFDQLAEETIPAEFDSFESFEIGFDSRLLLKCIEEISSDEVTLTFSDPTRQALIFPKGDEIEKTILIMPLMINI